MKLRDSNLSSRSKMFFKIDVLNILPILQNNKFVGDFFKKVAGLKPTQEFSCEVCQIFKNTFFLKNTSGDCFWDSKLNLRILTTGGQQLFFRTHLHLQAEFEIVYKGFQVLIIERISR